MADQVQKKNKRPTAEKRAEQNKKSKQRNQAFKSRVKTALRCFEQALSKGEKGDIQTALNKVYSLMDKGVKTKTYKKHKAARIKSRIGSLQRKSA